MTARHFPRGIAVTIPRFSRTVYSRNNRGTFPPFRPQTARDRVPDLLRNVTTPFMAEYKRGTAEGFGKCV